MARPQEPGKGYELILPPTLEMTLLPPDHALEDTFLLPCYIEWIDSAGYSGWRDQEDVDRLNPYRCRTLAFIVQETEEAIIVTHTETYGIDASFTKLYHDLFSIPRRAIVRLVRLCVEPTL